MAKYVDTEQSYDMATLDSWYIASVMGGTPVWTEEHLEELLNDFYVIPKDTPASDVVSMGVHQQVRWERDIAIEQLESYGVGFAEEADVVKVKHGKWLVIENPNSLNVICSNCRENYYVFKKGQYRIEQSNYCPNCGAKMEGGIHLEK